MKSPVSEVRSPTAHLPGELMHPFRRTAHSLQAESAFRIRLTEAGAQLLEPSWLGNAAPHRVRCPVGHLCTPRPSNIQQGQGMCRTCARKDPASAAAAFVERLTAAGAVLLETVWLGVHTPHRIRCAAGHTSCRRPSALRRSGRVCSLCPRRRSASGAGSQVYRDRGDVPCPVTRSDVAAG